MNRRRLRIYLNDHLAAAAAVAARASACAAARRDTDLDVAIAAFADEAAEDRDEIIRVMYDLGLRRNHVKVAAAIAAERTGRLKLNGSLVRYSPLSRLEELELFTAGAAANALMWETMRELSDVEPRLDASKAAARQRRASERSDTLAELRRHFVRQAFAQSGAHLP